MTKERLEELEKTWPDEVDRLPNSEVYGSEEAKELIRLAKLGMEMEAGWPAIAEMRTRDYVEINQLKERVASLRERIPRYIEKDASEFSVLLNLASRAAVSFDLNFSECEGNFEFRIISAAPSDEGYIKRAHSLRQCIDLLKEKTGVKELPDAAR